MLRPAAFLLALSFAAPAAGQEGGALCGTEPCVELDGNGLVRIASGGSTSAALAQATALRRLHETEFWTAPVVSLARWTLESAPPGAVLLAQTDGDAVPLLMLQTVEGLRPDVAVLHIGLLGYAAYVADVAHRAGLPPPEVLADTALADTSSADVFRDALLAEWTARSLAGTGRPLVGALTLDPEVLGRHAPVVVSAGAYQMPGAADAPPFDLVAAEASADRVRGRDFVGPRTSPGDRDPERLASPVDLGGVVLFQLLQTAVSHAQAGDAGAAERAYARARTFAAEARIADDPLVAVAREWIDEALAQASN
jgi:hypothetical protein